jgi:DNA replication protein DnaC
MTARDLLRERAAHLGLWGLLARWDEFAEESWLEKIFVAEEEERARRSLERRLKLSRLGNFKMLVDFDWSWPVKLDRALLDQALSLDFLKDAGNIILVGPNGVGKTTLASNIVYKALLAGHTVLRARASEMLGDLIMQESQASLTRRLKRYCNPALLFIDEVGYLSYDNRHGDLFFEVVCRRHEKKSIVLTTNKPFGEWNEIFPSSSCVTALVDRLVHKAQILSIEGKSYRLKEASERMESKAKARKKKSS